MSTKYQDLSLLVDFLSKPDYEKYSQKIKQLLVALGYPDIDPVHSPELRNKILTSARNAMQRMAQKEPLISGTINTPESLYLYKQLYDNLLVFSWPEVADALTALGYSPEIAKRLEEEPQLRTQTIQIMRTRLKEWQRGRPEVKAQAPVLTAGLAGNMLGPDFTQELYQSGARSLKFQALASLPGGVAAMEKYYGMPITGDLNTFLRSYNFRYYTLDCETYYPPQMCISIKAKWLASQGDYDGVVALLGSVPVEDQQLRQAVVVAAIYAFGELGRKDLIDALAGMVDDINQMFVNGAYLLVAGITGDADLFLETFARVVDAAPPPDDEFDDYEEYVGKMRDDIAETFELAIHHNHVDFLKHIIDNIDDSAYDEFSEKESIKYDIIAQAIRLHRFDIVDQLGGLDVNLTHDVLRDAIENCDNQVIDHYANNLDQMEGFAELLDGAVNNDCAYMVDKFLPHMPYIMARNDYVVVYYPNEYNPTKFDRQLITMAGKHMTKQLKVIMDGVDDKDRNSYLWLYMLNEAARFSRFETFEMLIDHPKVVPYLEEMWKLVTTGKDLRWISSRSRYLITKALLTRQNKSLNEVYRTLGQAILADDTHIVKAVVEWLLDKGLNVYDSVYQKLLALVKSPQTGEQLERLRPLVV